MDAQLEQLALRLEALDCLARPTRRAILEYARAHFTLDDLQRYLHDRLDFIERYLARIDMPAFRNLCARLAAEEDLTVIQSELGQREGGDHSSWFLLIINPTAPEIVIFCFANHLALPMLDLHPPEVRKLFRMTEILIQADLLRLCGGKEETWHALERQLGLEGCSCEHPAEIRARLEASLGEFPLFTQDTMVSGLAEALVSAKDFDRAAKLLVAHLRLDGLVPWTQESLEAHFQQHLDESISDARSWCAAIADSPMAHLLTWILRLPTHFLANLVRILTSCHQEPELYPLRVTILNAFLGTRTDAYQNLDRLRRRIDDLDEDELWSFLELWEWALKKTNQQDAAVEALSSYLANILAVAPDMESSEAANPFAGPEGSAFAYLLGLLARVTEDAERDARRLRLLEQALAISDWNYVASAGLGEHLRQRLRTVRSQAALRLLGIGYVHLTGVMPPSAAVGVLEDFLQLREELYDDTDRLREHLRRYWEGKQFNISSFMWVFLAFGLQLRSRPFQGLQVVLANLQTRFSSAGIKELRDAVWGLAPERANWVLAMLVQILTAAGRFTEALPLCESLLQLDEPLYSQRDALRQHFRENLKHLEDNTIASLVHGMACGLTWGGVNPSRAILLLESFLGIDPELYDRPEDLRAFVDGLWYTREPGLAAMPLLQLAFIFTEQVHLEGARLLLEALCNIHDEDYSDPLQLRNQVQERFAQLDFLGEALFSRPALGLLLTILDEQDRSDRVGPLLQVLCADLSFLDSDSANMISAESNCILLERLLLYLGLSDRDRGMDFCRRLVPFLRASIGCTQESFFDRLRLLDSFEEVRSRLSFVVNYWIAHEPGLHESHQLRIEALCWDAELGQRMLLERFRVLRQVPVLGDGAVTLAPGWPYFRALSSTRRPSVNFSRLGCFSALEGTVPLTATNPSLLLEPSRFLERSLPPEGIEPRHLAAALGPGVLLIRASFAADNRLVWSAFRSDGQDLLLLESDEGKGQPEDRDQLRAAVKRHDEAIATIWAKWKQLWVRLQDAGLINDIEQLGVALEDSLGWSDLPDLWQELIERASGRGLADLAGELARFFPDGWLPPAESQRSDWVAERKGQWRQFWRDRLERLLDDATRAFIHESAAFWPLDKLARHLNVSLDVVFQVDDVLHALPFAYLTVGERPLCQQVRSVRSVFSVLLQDWQRELDRRALQVPAPRPPKTLVVSWCEPRDNAGDGAELLHRLMRQLAQQNRQCIVYAAAENPQGSQAWLAQGLRQLGPLQVVTVCGHGHPAQSGVRLADGIWDGKGCDLSQVELLLQVSCSIGRARQTGLRDVAGFCIELTVSRARSVLAGKWPVHSVESAHFAHRVVGHYLALREQLAPSELVSDRSLRAQAVNLTRCELLNGATLDVGLNTAGGFELYGLGQLARKGTGGPLPIHSWPTGMRKCRSRSFPFW